jgi:glycosyltransferase involved in cell wall biosynthesis
MRVLVVPRDFPSAHEPQAGIFVLRQIQALQALGHTVSVLRFVPKAPPFSPKWRAYGRVPERYSLEGVTVHTMRVVVPPQMLGLGLVRAQVAPALRSEIRAFAAELVHVHCVLPTAALARGTDVPMILTAHGSDAYVEPWRRSDLREEARAALARAASVVAVSGFVKQSVAALGRPDAAVIFNGADERVFSPKARALARTALSIDPRRHVVAFAGNLLKAKGIYDLADALGSLSALRPLALFAGDGPEIAGLRERLGSLGVDHRLLGRVSQHELATLLGASDVFAFPSHAEGLPGAVCEAMLSGRAVVASAVGGIPEIVKDGETGLLVPKADPAALANAIGRILGDDARRGELERKAHDFAQRHLTWRVNAAAYDALYRETLARHAVSHRSA